MKSLFLLIILGSLNSLSYGQIDYSLNQLNKSDKQENCVIYTLIDTASKQPVTIVIEKRKKNYPAVSLIRSNKNGDSFIEKYKLDNKLVDKDDEGKIKSTTYSLTNGGYIKIEEKVSSCSVEKGIVRYYLTNGQESKGLRVD